jgi:FkbM family methyltransferase
MALLESLRLAHRGWRYRLGSNRAEVAFVRDRVHAGDVAIDLGAHKGAYLYWLRSCVGPGGQVIAFEPQPTLATALHRIIERRGWTNTSVHQLAVADAPGLLPLVIPGDGGPSPGARLVAEGEDTAGYGATVEVEVVTLDAFLAERPRPIRFIKCDVEGVELSVFRGARDLLCTDRPDLMFECEQRHLQDDTVQTVFDWLQSLGYRGRFFHRGRLRPIEEFDPVEHQSVGPDGSVDHADYCNNFAFVADSTAGG